MIWIDSPGREVVRRVFSWCICTYKKVSLCFFRVYVFLSAHLPRASKPLCESLRVAGFDPDGVLLAALPHRLRVRALGSPGSPHASMDGAQGVHACSRACMGLHAGEGAQATFWRAQGVALVSAVLACEEDRSMQEYVFEWIAGPGRSTAFAGLGSSSDALSSSPV